MDDRIYFFQHRLLPRWTHESRGSFFDAIKAGPIDELRSIASEVVDAEFAAALRVLPLGGPDQVVIAFAPPKEPPECFCVLILRSGESYRYLTLEMSDDLFKEGDRSVIGEWTPDGTHANFGHRKYADVTSFIADEATAAKQG